MPGLLEKDQVGKREDLADLVALVDVRSTPFTSMVRKESKPTNTLCQWQVDKYDSVKVAPVVDGTDVSEYENAAKDRALLYNHVQIFRRTAKVSRLAEDVSVVAGVPSEMARSVMKKLVEIKRDMEASFLGDLEAQADDGTVGYQLRGMDKWIQTTAQSLYPVPASYRPASAQVNSTATASLVETDVQTVLQSVFDTTGMTGTYVLFAGSVLRRAFTDFTRVNYLAVSNGFANKVRTFNTEMTNKTITSTTTVFEGDFGTVTIVPSSWLGAISGGALTVDTDRGYLLDMDKVNIAFNKRPSVESLPDLGGGPRRLVEAVATMKVLNPIGLAKFKP